MGDEWALHNKQGWFQEYFEKKDEESQKEFTQPIRNRRESSEESSIIIADPNKLELHLSYSQGLERGPIIQRTGDTPPIMEDPEQPGRYTTDPDEQRIGSYYITEEKKYKDICRLFYCFASSYILYGRIATDEAHKMAKDVSSDEARELAEKASGKVRELAENILISYHSNAPTFLFPPSLKITNFGVDIVKFSNSFKQYLQSHQNMDSLHKNFQFAFSKLNDATQNDFVDDADKCIRKLYYNDYPDLDLEFGNYLRNRNFRNTVIYNVKKFLRLLLLALGNRSHEAVIRERAKTDGLGKVVLMQGCGDLTMNAWNVAFVSGPSNFNDKNTWSLLYPDGEPLNDRTYSCLFKWSCNRNDPELINISNHMDVVYPYQIGKLLFKASSLGGEKPANGHVFINNSDTGGGQQFPIGHLIEFAVYGQQLYRYGKEMQLQSIIHEFGDIRHVYLLPNLNRSEDYETEAKSMGIDDYGSQPRNLFNRSARNDVWLGERSLIQGDRNLKVAALKQSIQLPVSALGAPAEWIEIVLKGKNNQSSYSLAKGETLEEGEWRWVQEGQNKWLEIYFLQNNYPSTLIGIETEKSESDTKQKENNANQPRIYNTKKIYFSAHGHNYNSTGCTILEAAKYMSEQGAKDILMFDEGNDVFQLIKTENSQTMRETVPINNREQIRCVFWATSHHTL